MSSANSASMWFKENISKKDILKRVYKEVKQILSKSTAE